MINPAIDKILNRDEVDALLNGMDDVRAYDFANDLDVVRRRMPALEMINDRFAHLFHQSVLQMFGRGPAISVSQVTVKRFDEYLNTLHTPSNLNIVRINPLRGLALVVMDPKLVFTAVDNFFGGVGRHAKVEGRDFTATEQRIIQTVLRHAFDNLKEAWSGVAEIEFEHVNSELNPHAARIAKPSEQVVISSFHIGLQGGGGDLHVTIPCSMLEPLRAQLASGTSVDDREIELNAVLGESTVTFADLLNLKSGDVIPCDFNGSITLNAQSVPLFRGSFGVSRGQQAVKVSEQLNRVKAAVAANPIVKS